MPVASLNPLCGGWSRYLVKLLANFKSDYIKENSIKWLLWIHLVTLMCDIYIVPYSARSCYKVLYNISLSLTQTCFHPAQISTPNGAYNGCCHYRHKALLKHIAIVSCQVLNFYGWVNQSPHDSIAAHIVSNPWRFGYQSYALTNCAITAFPSERVTYVASIQPKGYKVIYTLNKFLIFCYC